MKIKILLICYLIILLTSACQKDNLKDITINEIRETTKTTTKKEIETTTKLETPTTSKKIIKTTKKVEPKTNQVIIEETVEEDAIDENHPDYPIHKGRIDCQTESECMELSLPIQFKYKKNIANTFYTAIISKQNKVLGYFIEYIFTENQYEMMEECRQTGESIKETLSDRITNYECNEENILKINTDY